MMTRNILFCLTYGIQNVQLFFLTAVLNAVFLTDEQSCLLWLLVLQFKQSQGEKAGDTAEKFLFVDNYSEIEGKLFHRLTM